MDKQLQIFNNEEFGEVRVIGDFENPQFCLADVCRVLELDASQVMKRLDDGVVSIHPISDSLGRTQMANFVNEDGLYDVILDSRKPNAKKFRKWLTGEVLPSIRKTGGYSVRDMRPLLKGDEIHIIGTMANDIQSLFAVKRGIAIAQAIDVVGVNLNLKLDGLKQLIPPAEHKTGFLNPTQIGKRLGGLPPQFINKMLAEKGLEHKEGKYWRLTEAGKEYGEELPFTRNGHSGYQIRWSEKVVDILRAYLNGDAA